MTFLSSLVSAFGAGRVRAGERLAPYTTFGVGGPADWLVDVRSPAEVRTALDLARGANVPVSVVGGGSNVLVADDGVSGLVIRIRGGTVTQLDDRLVRSDAGVALNSLVRWTIARGLAGLEAFAGTPGTVGGAIHGNVHYGGRSIGDLVDRVAVVALDGMVNELPHAELDFAYDRSRLQISGDVLLSAVFGLLPGGDAAALRKAARASLAQRLRTQPLAAATAGCIFQNPDPAREPVPAGVPPSAGALIDRAGLKGRAVGAARVSEMHGNFIVNEGQATAADIRALIEMCRREVYAQFGVRLREEIVYLGRF